MNGVRLTGSHHLYLGADGGWRLAGPGDTFERLRVPHELGSAVERLLSGRASYPAAVRQAGGPEQLDPVLRALAGRGLLAERGDGLPAGAPSGCRVAVLGHGGPADRVGELLAAARHEVVRAGAAAGTELGDPAGFDALVCCAGWLPDLAWQRLDDRCLQSRLPWHRCHHETGSWVVGPFSIPDRTASYRDTRARRLAAAALPEELAAAWRHLDDSPPAVVDPDPATAAVIAGLLANDVLAFLADRPVPTAGDQLVLDLTRMSVDRHPVLPLPAEAGAGRG